MRAVLPYCSVAAYPSSYLHSAHSKSSYRSCLTCSVIILAVMLRRQRCCCPVPARCLLLALSPRRPPPTPSLVLRALHGGCKPRGEGVEKWGANQWIWNHPQRSSFFSTVPQRKGAPPQAAQALGCTDDSEDCAAWAQSGECVKNMAYMHKSCRASCNAC